MKVFQYPAEKEQLQQKLEKRKHLYDRSLIAQVNGHFLKVQENGDKAILQLTRDFDKVDLKSIALDQDCIDRCVSGIDPELREAILHAGSNIIEVNSHLLGERLQLTEIREGTTVGEKISPLESVGLWVPARKGPLISTALMLVGAAKSCRGKADRSRHGTQCGRRCRPGNGRRCGHHRCD